MQIKIHREKAHNMHRMFPSGTYILSYCFTVTVQTSQRSPLKNGWQKACAGCLHLLGGSRLEKSLPASLTSLLQSPSANN